MAPSAKNSRFLRGVKKPARYKRGVLVLRKKYWFSRTALHLAAMNGRTRVVEILLSRGSALRGGSERKIAKKDLRGATPLDMAAIGGHVDVVSLLLEAGAEPNAGGYGGVTPLYYAVQGKHLMVAQKLLEGGADPAARNSYGETALHAAARTGHVGLVDLLLRANVSPDEQNNSGQNALDVTSCGLKGTTALHIAAAKGYCECISLLLGYGADIYQRDSQEHTALHLAVLHGQPEALSLLLQTADLAEIGLDFFAAFSKVSLLDQQRQGVHFNCSSFEMLEPSLLALAEASNMGVLKAFFELQKRSASKLWELKANPTSSKSLVRLLMENNPILDWDNPEGKEIIGHSLRTYPEAALRLIMIAKEELFVDSFLEVASEIAVRNGVRDVVDFLLQIDPARVQSLSVLIIERIFNEMKGELSSIPAQRFEKKTIDKLEQLRRALSGLDAERIDAALNPWHDILPRVPFAALACGNEGLLRILPRNIVAGAGKDMQGFTLPQRAFQFRNGYLVEYILKVTNNQ